MCYLIFVFQKWIRCAYCYTLSYSCWVCLVTCSSLWFWWWISECGRWPTHSCSPWPLVISWWLFSACPSLLFPTCWRISSSELPCARLWPILWVRWTFISSNLKWGMLPMYPINHKKQNSYFALNILLAYGTQGESVYWSSSQALVKITGFKCYCLDLQNFTWLQIFEWYSF